MELFDTPSIFEQFPGLVAAQSRRHGGISTFPYESLNLSLHTKDDPQNIRENRTRFCQRLDIPIEKLAESTQVHRNKVLVVEAPVREKGYDALITNIPDLYLAVGIADCTPVLVYHPESGAVAAIHAGWRGTVANIVQNTIEALEKFYGATPEGCYAYVGTCISVAAYEVGEEVAAQFDAAFKIWDTEKGKHHIDLKAANRSQLINMGVPADQIEVSPFCTVQHNEEYFSHRAEKGKTGRMLALIGQRT